MQVVAVAGIIVSIIAVLAARYGSDLNFFFYGVIGAMSVVIIGTITAPFSRQQNKFHWMIVKYQGTHRGIYVIWSYI